MATPLDISLLDTVGVIFPFLFVAIMTYAILSRFKFFGDRKGLDALIAIVLAVIVIFTPIVRDTISLMAPWFVLFFFFLVFLVISFMIFGASSEDILNAMKNNRVIVTWIIAFGVIFFLGSLASVVSERGGIGATGSQKIMNASGDQVGEADQTSAFWATIVHPKVLGLALILLIATFTVQRMSTM
jgi:hypothetical protein